MFPALEDGRAKQAEVGGLIYNAHVLPIHVPCPISPTCAVLAQFNMFKEFFRAFCSRLDFWIKKPALPGRSCPGLLAKSASCACLAQSGSCSMSTSLTAVFQTSAETARDFAEKAVRTRTVQTNTQCVERGDGATCSVLNQPAYLAKLLDRVTNSSVPALGTRDAPIERQSSFLRPVLVLPVGAGRRPTISWPRLLFEQHRRCEQIFLAH